MERITAQYEASHFWAAWHLKKNQSRFFLSPANSKDHKLAVIPTQVKGCRWITRSSCGVCPRMGRAGDGNCSAPGEKRMVWFQGFLTPERGEIGRGTDGHGSPKDASQTMRPCWFHRQEGMGNSCSECLILDHLPSFAQAHSANAYCSEPSPSW